MSCNSESRRVINYSQYEPINNKYDLWLSENLRYNSGGTLVYDSPGQPACDLILKIYKDGDWRPIAGLNTDHIVANKINIVKDVNYTYISPNDNIQHINNGFQQNHLPLFRNPDDSPNELFDAGTLGNAIYGFVTETEWQNIFEGDAFSGAFTYWFPTIINNGDININELIELANTEQIGGIKADVHNHYTNAFKPVECKLYPDYGSWSSIHERLCINAHDVIDSIIESFSDPDENWLFGNHGITIGQQLGGNRIEWAVDGLGTASNGQYARCRVTEGVSRRTIEWVDLPEGNTYPVLSRDDHYEGTDYVVNGGGKEGTYLDYNGEWTVPDGINYVGSEFIGISGSQHSIYIKPYVSSGDTRRMFISSRNGYDVEWYPVRDPILYNGISPISVNNNSYNIEIQGTDDENQVLYSDGRGGVRWERIETTGGESYDAGDGIQIVEPQFGNKQIKCKISECEDDGYNSGISALNSIEFRAPIPEGSVIKNVITLNVDANTPNQNTYQINPYTYTKIDLANSGEITFVIDGQMEYMQGDPVYVILYTHGKQDTYTIEIQDSQNADLDDFISINDALVSDGLSMTFGGNAEKYLITMQFGIVKIEPIGYINQIDNPKEEEE